MMKKKQNVALRVFFYGGKSALLLIPGLILSAGGVFLSLFVPVLTGRGVDMMLAPGKVDFKGILSLCIELLGVIGAGALLQWLSSLCTNRVAFKTSLKLRDDVFKKLGEMPLSYIDGGSRGDILSRMITDIEQISDGLLQGFAQFFSGIITIIGTIAFMLSVNVKITAVVVILTPISLFVAYFIARGCNKMFTRQNKIRGELGGLAEEMISSAKTVKAFAYEDPAQRRFEEINARLYESGVKAQFYSALTNPCTRFVNGLVFAAVGVTGALNVLSGGVGAMSVGQLSSFLAYANQYTKPFNEITGVITELQNAFAGAARVFEILDAESESDDSLLPELKECDGSVEMRDVSFSYSPDKPLIEHLNLTAKPGQLIAIVGPTGCGKTTLINLLMRFYDVNSGEISVSGTPIKDIKRSSLRECYGMVLQDTWLFSGTVRENIAYGRPNASDEDILNAAKLAHAHSFIKRLENGYDTVISEGGGNLSHGQKQLLCIARIMLTSPPMLILDEATSSIDTRTEIKIQEAFDRMMQSRTSFIVAHRLSTIRQADVILVMNKGSVVEQGSHRELLQKGGFYAQLYNSQFETAQ